VEGVEFPAGPATRPLLGSTRADFVSHTLHSPKVSRNKKCSLEDESWTSAKSLMPGHDVGERSEEMDTIRVGAMQAELMRREHLTKTINELCAQLNAVDRSARAVDQLLAQLRTHHYGVPPKDIAATKLRRNEGVDPAPELHPFSRQGPLSSTSSGQLYHIFEGERGREASACMRRPQTFALAPVNVFEVLYGHSHQMQRMISDLVARLPTDDPMADPDDRDRIPMEADTVTALGSSVLPGTGAYASLPAQEEAIEASRNAAEQELEDLDDMNHGDGMAGPNERQSPSQLI